MGGEEGGKQGTRTIKKLANMYLRTRTSQRGGVAKERTKPRASLTLTIGEIAEKGKARTRMKVEKYYSTKLNSWQIVRGRILTRTMEEGGRDKKILKIS